MYRTKEDSLAARLPFDCCCTWEEASGSWSTGVRGRLRRWGGTVVGTSVFHDFFATDRAVTRG